MDRTALQTFFDWGRGAQPEDVGRPSFVSFECTEAAKKLDLDLAEGRQLPDGFHPELDLQIWGAGCGRRNAIAAVPNTADDDEGGRVSGRVLDGEGPETRPPLPLWLRKGGRVLGGRIPGDFKTRPVIKNARCIVIWPSSRACCSAQTIMMTQWLKAAMTAAKRASGSRGTTPRWGLISNTLLPGVDSSHRAAFSLPELAYPPN